MRRQPTAVEMAAQKLLHPGSTTVPIAPMMALARLEMAGVTSLDQILPLRRDLTAEEIQARIARCKDEA